MSERNGIAPCGQYVDDLRREWWRQEMSCNIIGCDNCSLHQKDEPMYYISSQENMKKGLAIWAKHMLGELEYD